MEPSFAAVGFAPDPDPTLAYRALVFLLVAMPISRHLQRENFNDFATPYPSAVRSDVSFRTANCNYLKSP